VPRYWQTKTVVEWQPNVSFEEGLKRTITWFSEALFSVVYGIDVKVRV
jgi:dTDP-D-glucose 4,6-dehydratase